MGQDDNYITHQRADQAEQNNIGEAQNDRCFKYRASKTRKKHPG